MILPVGAPTFAEAIRYGAEVFHNLSKVLKAKRFGDDCPAATKAVFAPNLSSNEEAIEAILEAIQKAGYLAGRDITWVWTPPAPNTTKAALRVVFRKQKLQLN